MIEVTQDAIQVLLDRPKGEGLIVSCYADTSVTNGFQWLWSQRLKSEASAVEQRLKDDHQARARFLRDLEIVRHALEDPAVQRTRGMAVFSQSDRKLFRAFSLGVPVADRLVVDEAPYLVPLLEALHRQRRYLVVLTDTHHGEIYEAAWGHTRLLQQLDADVPRRQRSSGQRWGKQQATMARHREDHVRRYLADLARAVGQAWADAPFRGVIVLGEPDTVEAWRARLPAAIAGRIVHAARYSWARRGPNVDDEAQAVIDEALRAHDAELTAECERRLHEHHLIAAGPQEVVNALRNGQVGYPGYLVLEPDRGQTAARCTRCESLFVTPYETCPVCTGPCETVNLWQEILLFAARHDITAHTVASAPALTPHGGIAAVLSRSEPWEPAQARPA